jgi:hypothetical protein
LNGVGSKANAFLPYENNATLLTDNIIIMIMIMIIE